MSIVTDHVHLAIKTVHLSVKGQQGQKNCNNLKGQGVPNKVAGDGKCQINRVVQRD